MYRSVVLVVKINTRVQCVGEKGDWLCTYTVRSKPSIPYSITIK